MLVFTRLMLKFGISKFSFSISSWCDARFALSLLTVVREYEPCNVCLIISPQFSQTSLVWFLIVVFFLLKMRILNSALWRTSFLATGSTHSQNSSCSSFGFWLSSCVKGRSLLYWVLFAFVYIKFWSVLFIRFTGFCSVKGSSRRRFLIDRFFFALIILNWSAGCC